jgi:hypothetical protein
MPLPTPNLQLPYPGLTDAPSGPGAIQALADRLDLIGKAVPSIMTYRDTATLSVPTATWTPFAPQSSVGGGAGLAISGSRVVTDRAGTFLVVGRVAYNQSNGAAGTQRQAHIRANAAGLLAGGTMVAQLGAPPQASTSINQWVSCGPSLVTLAAGGYVELFAYQDSGAGHFLPFGIEQSGLVVVRLGL